MNQVMCNNCCSDVYDGEVLCDTCKVRRNALHINPRGIKPLAERFTGTIVMMNCNDPMAYAGLKHLDADGNNWVPLEMQPSEDGICENCGDEGPGYVQADTTGRMGSSMFFCLDCTVTFYVNRRDDAPVLQYFINTDNYYLEA